MPPGYYITYGGAFENLEAAKARLWVAVPVSLVLIFLLLFFAFRSVRQGLLIYSAIPLSAIGGILALAIRGLPFSISAGVGFIALFGVAVLNGIVLIAEFNRLKEGGITDLKRIVIKGTKTRLRPVLMTAFVASLGFLPMAISTGEGAEVQRPLATVVIGGLLIATFLTLFVLPILYIMFQKGTPAKKTVPVAVMLVLVLGSLVTQANAQTPISLQAAIDTAQKNNLVVKNEKLRATYQQQLIKTAKNLPVTGVMADVGQINSAYADIKFGISQTISFSRVYAAQRALLTQQYQSVVLNVGIKEATLRKQVAQAYYSMVYVLQKRKLLQKTDSLFTEFLNKATLRLNKGEANILEKATAENQRGQIALQLAQLEEDFELLKIQFQLLLNSDTKYIPNEADTRIAPLPVDTSYLSSLPIMQYLRQQQQVAAAVTEAEKAKLLPDFTAGYNVMSIRGAGADNKTYNGVPRFQSVQVGLGIPIFTSGQKAKINAAKLNEQLTAREYELNLKNLESTYRATLAQFRKYEQAVSYFENTALRNAELITETAKKQFIGGDINYLEWVLLVNQAVTIQNEYVDAVRNRNNSIIELNSFTTQQ